MRHKTQAEMEILLRSYRNHEGTQKDFCAAHGIRANQLHYWQRKLSKTASATKSNKFIPLKVEAVELTERIEINYPNGNTVRIPATTAVKLVEQLLQIRC